MLLLLLAAICEAVRFVVVVVLGTVAETAVRSITLSVFTAAAEVDADAEEEDMEESELVDDDAVTAVDCDAARRFFSSSASCAFNRAGSISTPRPRNSSVTRSK